MNIFYSIVVILAYQGIRILAVFKPKLKLFVTGRKKIAAALEVLQPSDRVLWFHTSSLGEFEQARPLIEQLKKSVPNAKIVVTFFSPSGYEIRKNYPLADVVCYLPFDTPNQVQKFITQLQPSLAVFVKYDFWPNLLKALKQQKIPTLLVSGIFRKNQVFFKPWGSFMRTSLTAFEHFFVQDEASKALLERHQFTNVTVCGDTRFDRVYQITQEAQPLAFVARFCKENYTIVAGSTWKEDEALLVSYINSHLASYEKVIIAPHTINAQHIKVLQESLQKKSVLYSAYHENDAEDYQVLILDTIGILTQVYAYATVAYVGGGLATGLHNILEPAAYGIPVVFGNKKYHKFKEATDLLALNACETVADSEDFSRIFTRLRASEEERTRRGTLSKNYITAQLGATKTITNYIQNTIDT